MLKEAKAVVLIELPREKAEIIKEAIEPETGSSTSDRSRTRLQVTEGGLQVVAEAADTTALRASLNSYLRWIQGILEVMKSLG